jgi:hypothetical protein
LLEAAVEVLEIGHAGQRAPLVDDRVRLRSGDGSSHGVCVEQVEHDGLRVLAAEALRLVSRPRRADYLVAAFYELRNEPPADRAGRPCYEDSHRFSPGCVLEANSASQVRRTLRGDTKDLCEQS